MPAGALGKGLTGGRGADREMAPARPGQTSLQSSEVPLRPPAPALRLRPRPRMRHPLRPPAPPSGAEEMAAP